MLKLPSIYSLIKIIANLSFIALKFTLIKARRIIVIIGINVDEKFKKFLIILPVLIIINLTLKFNWA